jgi:hypothetical protein
MVSSEFGGGLEDDAGMQVLKVIVQETILPDAGC